MKLKLIVVPFLVVLAVAALLVTAAIPTRAAFAQACDPTDKTCVSTSEGDSSVPTSVGLVDVAFVLATVAFFKVQFDLKGKYALGAAFIVCLFVALGSLIGSEFPKLGAWFLPLAGLVKLFLFAAGGYDFLTDVGPKFMGAIQPTAPH